MKIEKTIVKTIKSGFFKIQLEILPFEDNQGSAFPDIIITVWLFGIRIFMQRINF